MKIIIATVATMLITGCATTEHTVKEIETKNITVKGRTLDGGSIAVTEKGQAIIQNEKSVQDELVIQEMVNSHLMDDVQREAFDLKQCRIDLANPRLGGSGEMAASPAVDISETKNGIQEEMGINEDGDLKIVTREFLDQKLKSQRKFEITLRSMLKILKPQREECDRRLSYARIQHGLSPSRYTAQGYFMQDGTWVETKHGESNINDAFEIAAKGAAKGGRK